MHEDRVNPLKWMASLLFFASFPLMSCATKTVTFAVVGTGKVTTVSPDNLDKEGQYLGETPLTIETDKIQGKIVKISQKGKIPAYWIMPDVSGQNLRATLALADEPKAPAESLLSEKSDKKSDSTQKTADSKATINRLMRLLLKSYQALAARNLGLAQELASRASTIDPEIAAPLVIKGIALMQSGDNAAAKAALSNARALDPEDKDIETLLKALR
jgi:hypothetical protein